MPETTEVILSVSGYGQRIKQARLDLAAKRGESMSLTEVAERVGVSHVSIGYWETERSEPGDVATWRKLAKALETTPGWLAFGEKNEVRVYVKETKREGEAAASPRSRKAR